MSEPTTIIDPPVTPYSPPGKIKAWIKELKSRQQTPDIRLALKEAEEDLKVSQENHR